MTETKSLKLRPKSECKWDEVSLGEVMLRLDPGDVRVATARQFNVWEGGGEYNVARGLRRCFGLKTAVVTALADNPVGRLVEDLMLQGGVDQSHVVWTKYDGVGRTTRNGLNFTERGFGVRAALGCSDRGNTAVSQLKPGQIDWDEIFGEEGARWFHTGGIFCALSETTPEVCKEAMVAARKYGTIISYDLNYRDSLWKSIGGKAKATEVNRELASYVDVMIGNEEDFTAALGFEIEGAGDELAELDTGSFRKMIESAVEKYPNFKAVGTTLRHAKTATVNDWGAVCYYEGVFHEARPLPDLEIFDRVGGGDSFASGLIYGFLNEKGADWAVNCGCAHGALAMTTPGDTTMATFDEVQRVMKGSELAYNGKSYRRKRGCVQKAKVIASLKEIGLVPVLRAESVDKALALAEAIAAGGVTVLEVTMTVPGAIQVMRKLAESRPDILIGAGTVLDAETARMCILEGAQFIVSPALNLQTIEMCHRYSIAVLPGALTPTEIVTAWQAGADVVKVFPASALGGAKYLTALKGPLPHVDLIPTGGVSLATAAEFLAAGAFALGVGSDLVDAKAMAAGKPEVVTETAKKYLQIVQEHRAKKA